MQEALELLGYLGLLALLWAGSNAWGLGLAWPPLLQLAVWLGLDPNRRDAEGETRLMRAVTQLLHSERATRILLRAGADVTAQASFGALTALHHALLVSTVEPQGVVAQLLEAGADPNAGDTDGATPLHYATQRAESAELVQALLAAGAQPNVADQYGTTPLMHGSQCAETVRVLLRAGAELEARDETGWTPLHHAILAESTAGGVALLDAGADLQSRDGDGLTPLMLAARSASDDWVERLLERGADATLRSDWGSTAAQLLGPRWQAGEYERSRTLLDVPSPPPSEVPGGDALHLAAVLGALPADLRDRVDRPARGGRTPLMLAAASPCADAATVEALLSAGADPAAADQAGRTALGYAVAFGDLERLERLLAAGAELDDGQFLLHTAARCRGGAMVRALLQAGADPQRRDLHGYSPLEGSLTNPDPSALEALLQAGVDPHDAERPSHHPPPLVQAASRSSREHVRLLLAAGARVDEPDWGGSTALHRAATHPRGTGPLEALLAAKAKVESRDGLDRTPLLVAAGEGTAAHVALLLRARARRRYGSNRASLSAMGALSAAGEAEGRPAEDPQRQAILNLLARRGPVNLG